MTHMDAQDARIADVLGDMLVNIEYTFEDCVNKSVRWAGFLPMRLGLKLVTLLCLRPKAALC